MGKVNENEKVKKELCVYGKNLSCILYMCFLRKEERMF